MLRIISGLVTKILFLYYCQPRILMAMARDGLLPSFFSEVDKKTQVPLKSTIVTGFLAALLAFFMDVEALSGMVLGYALSSRFLSF